MLYGNVTRLDLARFYFLFGNVPLSVIALVSYANKEQKKKKAFQKSLVIAFEFQDKFNSQVAVLKAFIKINCN